MRRGGWCRRRLYLYRVSVDTDRQTVEAIKPLHVAY